MNIAVSTTCSDGYVIFLEHFIKSILENNPDFDKDFLIYCDPRLSQLNRSSLKSLYSNFKFIDINYDLYQKKSKPHMKYYSIECFNQKDYDKVIYWGSDMLCKGNLDELFEVAESVEGIAMPKEIRRSTCQCPFNNGSMIIDKSLINTNTYNALLGFDNNKPPYNLIDQKLYNNFFDGRIKEISIKFNTLISEIQFIDWQKIIILHYIYKPTVNASIKQLNNVDPKLYKLWREYD